MAPPTLRKKHRIVWPSPSRRPYNKVYYELSSGEEDTPEAPGDAMERNQEEAKVSKGDHANHPSGVSNKGESLLPLRDNISLPKIDALNDMESICAQNTTLTHEVIWLEEQNRALRGIISNLEYLLKDKPTTSSPSSPKKDALVHGYGHHP